MKDNGSPVNGGSLKPDMYAEFAEHCAAVAKLYKRDCGIDHYALSIQNQPAFPEPYASAVYTAAQMRDAAKAVALRYRKEGITARIMIPEDGMDGWSRVRGYVDVACADTMVRNAIGPIGERPGWLPTASHT